MIGDRGGSVLILLTGLPWVSYQELALGTHDVWGYWLAQIANPNDGFLRSFVMDCGINL